MLFTVERANSKGPGLICWFKVEVKQKGERNIPLPLESHDVMWSKRQISRELHNWEDVWAKGRRNTIRKTLNDDKVCILHTGALGQSGKSKISWGWNGKISYQEMSVGLRQQCSVFQWRQTYICVHKCVFLCFAVLFLEITDCLKIRLTPKQCCCDTTGALGDKGKQGFAKQGTILFYLTST